MNCLDDVPQVVLRGERLCWEDGQDCKVHPDPFPSLSGQSTFSVTNHHPFNGDNDDHDDEGGDEDDSHDSFQASIWCLIIMVTIPL